MFKNNFILSEAYVSPAVKVAKIRARRVVCTSPTYGGNNEAGGLIYIDNDGEDIDL